MADTKISALTSGAPAQATDTLVIARAGANYRLAASDVVALAPQGTVTSVLGAGTVSGITLTGTVTGNGSLTLGGTLSTTASAISDFNSASRAQTEAELVPGANITITPSGTGATRQLTLAASGGGGTFDPINMFQAILYVPNSNASSTWVGGAVTEVGLATGTVANTNVLTSMRRNHYTTAGTANAAAYSRSNGVIVFRGDGSTIVGGFVLKTTFGVVTQVATGAGFFGLSDVTTWSGSDTPSNKTDIVGAGWDGSDTTLQIMHNDAAGVATKVNLGANFPITANAVYTATFDCAPNGSITYTVTRVDVAQTATGTLSTNLPTTTTGLGTQLFTANGATASAQSVASMGLILYAKRTIV